MSEVQECDQVHIDQPIEASETDHALCAQLALRMAALLPDDPEQGERVLEMVAGLYRVLCDDQASRTRARGLDG